MVSNADQPYSMERVILLEIGLWTNIFFQRNVVEKFWRNILMKKSVIAPTCVTVAFGKIKISSFNERDKSLSKPFTN